MGFTIDKQKATELFYQQNVKDSLKHSGTVSYTHLDVYKRQEQVIESLLEKWMQEQSC